MLERQKKQLKNRQLLIRTICVFLFLVFLVYMTFKMYPQIKWLSNPNNLPVFEEYLKSQGIKGVGIFLIIQISQVIIALIPGEPIEVVAGAMYGAFGGLLICMLGVFIGSFIVFYLVKLWGMSVVTIFIDEKKINELWFLKDRKKFEILTFFLFFVPGTPKDLLTYAAGLTSIKPIRFFFIATLARIPSILTSTMAGASLINGNFKLTVIIFACAGVISLTGYFLHRIVVRRRGTK